MHGANKIKWPIVAADPVKPDAIMFGEGQAESTYHDECVCGMLIIGCSLDNDNDNDNDNDYDYNNNYNNFVNACL